MAEWDQKVALITGASSGIGRATARTFAARGARVALAARRGNLLAELAEEIREAGGEATYLPTDVSVESDVEDLVDHTLGAFGRLDLAVNSAGTEGPIAGLIDMPTEEWQSVLDVNLKGPFLCMKYEARAMLDAGRGGAIVNVGSLNSFLGNEGGTAYATSKHGLVGLTTSASAELAPAGIRVNVVCPGVIDTPMHRRLRDEVGDELYDSALKEDVHQCRAGRPEEIADAVAFLCSEEASYITGTPLIADGGFLMTL